MWYQDMDSVGSGTWHHSHLQKDLHLQSEMNWLFLQILFPSTRVVLLSFALNFFLSCYWQVIYLYDQFTSPQASYREWTNLYSHKPGTFSITLNPSSNPLNDRRLGIASQGCEFNVVGRDRHNILRVPSTGTSISWVTRTVPTHTRRPYWAWNGATKRALIWPRNAGRLRQQMKVQYNTGMGHYIYARLFNCTLIG